MAIADFLASLCFIGNVVISVCKPVAYTVNYALNNDTNNDTNKNISYWISGCGDFAPRTIWPSNITVYNFGNFLIFDKIFHIVLLIHFH